MTFLGIVAFIIIIALIENHTSTSTNYQQKSRQLRQNIPLNDPLKAKGDRYEKAIGVKLEEKGELVIYNGFIRGYDDNGVDIVSISKKSKTINLVQCKNWTAMRMELTHVEKIYEKLNRYALDIFTIPTSKIADHLQIARVESNIRLQLDDIQNNLNSYKIYKTLYISSEHVVDLEIGQYLSMIKPDIFRYKDMKIVVHRDMVI